MIEIILLEIISIASFIYSILLLFMPFAPINSVFIVFIWTIISSTIFAINYRKGSMHKLYAVLLLLPLIFKNDSLSRYFIIMSTIIIVAYIMTSLLKGNHLEYADNLKNTYRIYMALTIMVVIYDGFSGALSYIIPFIIIYLLSGTILLRTMRHLDSGMGLKNIGIVNRRYIGIIVLLSSLVTLEDLRKLIFSAFNIIYTAIITITFKILYYPVLYILNALNKLWMLGVSKLNDGEIADYKIEGIEPELLDDIPVTLREFPMIKLIFNIGIIILLIYFIYKIIKKVDGRNYEGVGYREEREFIKRDKDKQKDRRKWKKEKYPKDIKNQIRYFYRRYLEKLQEEKVELFNTDTSLEINKKASSTFSKLKNEEIRDIYIKNRYSNKEISKEELEKMKDI